jgi:hypothetical protein
MALPGDQGDRLTELGWSQARGADPDHSYKGGESFNDVGRPWDPP